LSDSVQIRPAERSDVGLLLSLICELAEYERAADKVTGTVSDLELALFAERPLAEAVIAEVGQRPVGFALYFQTFSTWLCKPGLYLEDLYVRPEHRGSGVGRALMSHLADVTVRRGCARLEWSALSWNAPAIGFYERIGAQRLDEWEGFRLNGGALTELAREALGRSG
jgi:GNAT superfamily N-acetyltransferase